MLPEPGAIPVTIQCTYSPPTASGSSTTSASSAAPAGDDHVNGGATLAPLQLNCTGIGAPSANMGLAIVSGSAAGAGVVASTVVAFGTYGGVSRLSPAPAPAATQRHYERQPRGG